MKPTSFHLVADANAVCMETRIDDGVVKVHVILRHDKLALFKALLCGWRMIHSLDLDPKHCPRAPAPAS